MTTTLEIVENYISLLILQYVGKTRASNTIRTQTAPVIMPQTSVQTIAFSVAPTGGTFKLSYDDNVSASISWNDPINTIQTKIRAITAASVTVTGSIASLLLTVTFTDVAAPALALTVDTNALTAASDVGVTITETDLILPLAVQSGFDLTDGNLAVGDQLDVIGQYAGVTRTGAGFSTTITLSDSDFISLIRMAIALNTSGSSLSDIQTFLHNFFPSEVLVFDYQNMQMSYLISSAAGSEDLVQLFITENLLPRPMAVQVAVVIYAPVITTFFGFRTYTAPAFNSTPFNSYASYQTDWPWLSYANAISA